MKLYLECNMGAAGDMLMAALSELIPDRNAFVQQMNSLFPEVHVDCARTQKCGILGSKIRVLVRGQEESNEDVSSVCHTAYEKNTYQSNAQQEHAHKHGSHFCYRDICNIIGELDLPDKVKADALHVYRLIGEAESKVHSEPLEQIHFHEVGSLDAVVDVVGCCLLLYMLKPDDISASPIHVGSGFVRCSHGILPVPAPATALLLEGIPIYGGKIKSELCTPTGAALLRHFVRHFGEMEQMKVSKIGYGMGTKDFEALNCVRAFLYDSVGRQDEIIEICCNLDDMTPEALGFAMEQLLENGALDVFVTPIHMKKNRSAVMLSCLCKPGEKDQFADLMLKCTSTLGVRFHSYSRNVLSSTFYTVETPYGAIRIKSSDGYGVTKRKPEYDDVKNAALKFDVSFHEVYQKALAQMLETDH